MSEYRYRTIGDIVLRDDGYRVEFQLKGQTEQRNLNIDPDEWLLWAEYKQCDLPGPAKDIADYLMGE